MEEFDVQSNWVPITTPPLSGARYIVTDGDVIVIATYLSDIDGTSAWIFSGLTETDAKKFNVLAWMSLPRQFKKPVPQQSGK